MNPRQIRTALELVRSRLDGLGTELARKQALLSAGKDVDGDGVFDHRDAAAVEDVRKKRDAAWARLAELERSLQQMEDTDGQASPGDNDPAAGADTPGPAGQTSDSGSAQTTGSVGSAITASVGDGGRNEADDVSTVQSLLAKAGQTLTIDGLIGPQTINAIAGFQRSIGQSETGVIHPADATWQHLIGAAPPDGGGAGASAGGISGTEAENDPDGPDETEGDAFAAPEASQPTLRYGDEDKDGWVEYLQHQLRHHLGTSVLSVSGTFDKATLEAVRTFQLSTDPPCLVDGVVGNQTWSALRENPTRAEIGTDDRPAGTYSEEGSEARWGMESLTNAKYASGTDALRLVAVSVGTGPIEGSQVKVTVNGKTQFVEIGPAYHETSTGAGNAHGVFIENFKADHGPGPYDIEAIMHRDLGGDRWVARLEQLSGGDDDDDDDDDDNDTAATLTVGVFKNGDQGQPFEGALVALLELSSKSPAGAFNTGKNGIVSGISLAPGDYSIQVTTPSEAWTDETVGVTLEAGDEGFVPVAVFRQGGAIETGNLAITVVVDTSAGTVNRPDGHNVHVTGADGQRRTKAIQAGKALFSDLPIGEYSVNVDEIETGERWFSSGLGGAKVEAFFDGKATVQTRSASRVVEEFKTEYDVSVWRSRTHFPPASPFVIHEGDWVIGHATPGDNMAEWIPSDGEAPVNTVKAHHRDVFTRRHANAVSDAIGRIGHTQGGIDKDVVGPHFKQRDEEVTPHDVDGSSVGKTNLFVYFEGKQQTTLTYWRND